MEHVFKVYFAGDLFSYHTLIGNRFLSRAIERISSGRFSVVLPQNCEPRSASSRDIRNCDFEHLVESDCAVFCFDGADLDSGTVAEFMAAKFLDIPALIMRSDFRKCGDQDSDSHPWNLMCSFYPRTDYLILNSMELYKNIGDDIDVYTDYISGLMVDKLSSVLDSEPLSRDPEELGLIYKRFVSSVGGDFEKCFSAERLISVIRKKSVKGVY